MIHVAWSAGSVSQCAFVKYKAVVRTWCDRLCRMIWIRIKLPKYFNTMSSSEHYPNGERPGYAMLEVSFLCSVFYAVIFHCASFESFSSGDTVCLQQMAWTKEPKITIWFPLCFPLVPYLGDLEEHFQMLIMFVIDRITLKEHAVNKQINMTLYFQIETGFSLTTEMHDYVLMYSIITVTVWHTLTHSISIWTTFDMYWT